jgi:hypothetical protein
MKRYWSAILAATLLPACAGRAGAVSFLPIPDNAANEFSWGAGLAPGGEVSLPPSRFRVGLFAAHWKVPEVSISHYTGQAGDAVRFEATTMPVVEVDYRLGKRLRLGAWYNPADTRVWLKGPTADLLKTSPQPVIGSTHLDRTSLNMWNVNLAYQLPNETALALGVTRYQGTLAMRVPNWRGSDDLAFTAELGATELSLWGYRSLRIWEYTQRPAYLTGGLGLCHRVSHDSGSPGSKTTLEGSVGLAYFPWERLSLNAAVWLTDLTDEDAFTARVSTGITGHF